MVSNPFVYSQKVIIYLYEIFLCLFVVVVLCVFQKIVFECLPFLHSKQLVNQHFVKLIKRTQMLLKRRCVGGWAWTGVIGWLLLWGVSARGALCPLFSLCHACPGIPCPPTWPLTVWRGEVLSRQTQIPRGWNREPQRQAGLRV